MARNGSETSSLEENVVHMSSSGGDNGETPVGDIFDNLESLRLKQDFNRVKVKRPFTNCPIRKPRKHEWFQTRTDYRFETLLFEYKADMREEWYLPIGEDVLTEIEGKSLHPVTIFAWINRKHQVAIWPVRMADENGKISTWHESMYEAMSKWASNSSWIRIESADGGYGIEVAENDDLPGPDWPSHAMNEILRVAFKGGRVIASVDHPILQQLRGLA